MLRRFLDFVSPAPPGYAPQDGRERLRFVFGRRGGDRRLGERLEGIPERRRGVRNLPECRRATRSVERRVADSLRMDDCWKGTTKAVSLHAADVLVVGRDLV